jgi:NAD(P)-dependent dehydrogenase (short-subunit alcohol dehydrogenase family)
MRRWGRIDVLVNNAGIQYLRHFLEISENEWDSVLDTNLKGPFLFGQSVAREMITTGGGSIIHNASIDASAAEPDFASYNASKAGLQALSRTMALDLARYNIRSNTVSPGVTATDLMAVEVGPQMMEYLLHSFERVPMRRLMTTEEVAAVFLFLASDEASAITGTDITVDAGLTANLYILETLKASELFDATQSTGRQPDDV